MTEEFGGKEYCFYSIAKNKSEVKRLTKKLQKKGDSVKVTKTTDGYMIWIRTKEMEMMEKEWENNEDEDDIEEGWKKDFWGVKGGKKFDF